MAKEKLSFKSGSRFCYRVKENNLKSFYDKIVDVARSVSDEDFIIELRLDYLINKKIDVKSIPKFDILTAGFPCQTFFLLYIKRGE